MKLPYQSQTRQQPARETIEESIECQQLELEYYIKEMEDLRASLSETQRETHVLRQDLNLYRRAGKEVADDEEEDYEVEDDEEEDD